MKIDHLNITLTNAELTALLTVLRDHQNAKTATDVLFWARKTGNWANVTNYADWNVLANLPVSNLELWPIMLHLDEQVKNGLLELPKWALTKAQINRAIVHTGLTIQGTRGDGYFYFLNAEGHQVGESVMVCYLRQLPLHRWVRLAENALVPTNCFLHYAKTIG